MDLLKKLFFVSLASIFNASKHTKCMPLSNQKCKIQPTLINFHANEYNQELHCHPFAVKSDRCVGSCNTLNDLSNRVCAPNKTRDLNIHVLTLILVWGSGGILTTSSWFSLNNSKTVKAVTLEFCSIQ